MFFAASILAGASAHADHLLHHDEKFVVRAEALVSQIQLDYLRQELDTGLVKLGELGLHIDPALFPIIVRIRGGSGISYIGSQGEIVLHRLNSNRAPILHELTHLVAGYDQSLGHWTQEGFASYVQDYYGNNAAYPTYGLAHELAGLIANEDTLLPMAEVMFDRNLQHFFGTGDMWARWRAYVQATSFVTFLVETYGASAFLVIHNRSVEAIPFEVVFGKLPTELIADWKEQIAEQGRTSGAARTIFNNERSRARR